MAFTLDSILSDKTLNSAFVSSTVARSSGAGVQSVGLVPFSSLIQSESLPKNDTLI